MEPLYSFQISRPLLQAMALFQSGDESRRILCSTKFELVTNGMRSELTLVSTDGRRMGVHRHEIHTDNLLTDLPQTAEFSVDLKGIAKLPKAKGKAGKLLTCSVFPKHAEFFSEKYKYKADFVTEAKDGPNNLSLFPNWRQVIPVGEPSPIPLVRVNFELLSSFGDAAKLIEDNSSIICHFYKDEGPITVQFLKSREFYGVLMPIRKQENEEEFQQDWVRNLAEAKSA